VIQVLSRRTKNNPVLIGEPGVGKTAIAEGWPSASSRRRARGAEEQAVVALDLGAWWPAPSTAASSRTGSRPSSRRSPRAEGDHPLFIDELHTAGGRGRGRGGGGRLQHAQADAGPRRAALHRRDHAGRVPQVHREGRRRWSGASSRCWSTSRRGGHHRDPARPEGALRGAPRRAHPGLGAGRRGHALAPLHLRPLPARQGHRPDRRGASRLRMEIDSMPTEIDEIERGSCSSRSSARR
jgi:hypothetical protein